MADEALDLTDMDEPPHPGVGFDEWDVNTAAKRLCSEMSDSWALGAKVWTHVARMMLQDVAKARSFVRTQDQRTYSGQRPAS